MPLSFEFQMVICVCNVGKPECDGVEAQGKKSSIQEQGSTLRDLLTSTAGKLRLGSSGPGIAFAPVYNSNDQVRHTQQLENGSMFCILLHTLRYFMFTKVIFYVFML